MPELPPQTSSTQEADNSQDLYVGERAPSTISVVQFIRSEV